MCNRLPMIFSITALLVAVLGVIPLGEAAYNAVVPRNSVGTLQLKRNAVKAAKIAPNAVRTGHVVDGSLLTVDFKAGQIPQGPKGDKGDKGDKGTQGAPGVSGLERVTQESPQDSVSLKGATAVCPSGKKVVGGGALVSAVGPVALGTSNPAPDLTGWFAIAGETAAFAGNWRVTAVAICATVTP